MSIEDKVISMLRFQSQPWEGLTVEEMSEISGIPEREIRKGIDKIRKKQGKDKIKNKGIFRLME